MKTLLALVVAVVGLGAQAPASSLVGTYTCRGTQEGGPYTLHLTVKTHGPSSWLLLWSETKDSTPMMSGLAIRQHDQLAVALVSVEGHLGVASYVITAGHLNGLWAMGGGSVWPEHCQMGEPA